ncbi:type I-E CRISPR-associated protein Cas5/CasD [uncultured Microbulbifer sp.]|uniref:type I-E CRISPR-associated protein Cas5/CasD n=1 Tax=uncultured Microbulbifer sp. TaxID=348147 RepID=UPI00262370B3|nr:type I-E CRISPR-associated protein Cas5/CasD [uncultured Microbulbifer sp.]
MEYLVFRLYGAMASWGEVSVGESRHSAHYPGKSAITGLLAAALGIERVQEALQLELVNGYRQAVKVLSRGTLAKDYHTAQAPDSVGKFLYRTRRDELVVGRERLGTILSQREYIADAQALVAIKAMAQAHWPLEDLAQALARPKFHLYLGRKAFPLSAPTAAQRINADNFRGAFEGYQLPDLLNYHPERARQPRWLPADAHSQYYWEGDIEEFSAEDEQFSAKAVQQLNRLDEPLSRKRWQFQPRLENYWQS